MLICDNCGKPILWGYMTDDEGSFHTHIDACFEEYMDKTYGKHGWMELDGTCGREPGEDAVTDEYGGYYLVSWPNESGFCGSGIFYTELQEGDEDWLFDNPEFQEIVENSDDPSLIHISTEGKEDEE